MFKLPKTKKRKRIEAENEALKLQVSDLEYQLADKKSALKFFRESEKREYLEIHAEQRENKKLKKDNKDLRGEISELESQLREQNDADLMLLALQSSGLILSKGAVDKFVVDEATAKESVRKRMTEKGVESSYEDQMRYDRENAQHARVADLMHGHGNYGDSIHAELFNYHHGCR